MLASAYALYAVLQLAKQQGSFFFVQRWDALVPCLKMTEQSDESLVFKLLTAIQRSRTSQSSTGTNDGSIYLELALDRFESVFTFFDHLLQSFDRHGEKHLGW